MSFIKRQLTAEELSSFRNGGYNIIQRRVPDYDWEWAVDEENGILFTQLISNSNEMREGYYWYLLIVNSKKYIIRVNAWGGKRVNDQLLLNALLEEPEILSDEERKAINIISNEAMQVVSVNHDGLNFDHNQSVF